MDVIAVIQSSPFWLAVAVAIMGLCVGSFLNVVIHRLPKMMEAQWRADRAALDGKEAPPAETYNLVTPRSRCPSCDAPITALQNVPVVSWLALGGKCAACRAPISARYPAVELLAATLGVLVSLRFGYSWALVFGLVFTWALVALTFIDLDTQLLPDDITLPLLWVGLIANAFGAYTDLRSAVFGAVGGYIARPVAREERSRHAHSLRPIPRGRRARIAPLGTRDRHLVARPRAAVIAIALTGGVGSGKSTVAALFERLGARVVDTDEISRALTASGGAALELLREAFGERYFGADGALDRGAMRDLVFEDPAARARLESILHPAIRAAADAALSSSTGDFALLVVPLLFETGGYRNRVARTLVVDCPEAVQVKRTARRPGLSEDAVRRIMGAQWPRWRRLQVADDVVWNGGERRELQPQCERLHRAYCALKGGAT